MLRIILISFLHRYFINEQCLYKFHSKLKLCLRFSLFFFVTYYIPYGVLVFCRLQSKCVSVTSVLILVFLNLFKQQEHFKI